MLSVDLAIFTESGSPICVSNASWKFWTVIGLWSVGWCDGCLWPAHTMRRQLDRFDFRIGATTVALAKSTNDDRLWCAHTMRFSSFRRLWIPQKTKIAWCVPGIKIKLDKILNTPSRWVLSPTKYKLGKPVSARKPYEHKIRGDKPRVHLL